MMNFAAKLMSPQTARFILALLALGCSAYGTNKLLIAEGKEAGQAAIFAMGQLFALATMAFGYYFGSTAKGDSSSQKVEVTNTPEKPVPTENQEKAE
jgi:amino acid transporter